MTGTTRFKSPRTDQSYCPTKVINTEALRNLKAPVQSETREYVYSRL